MEALNSTWVTSNFLDTSISFAKKNVIPLAHLLVLVTMPCFYTYIITSEAITVHNHTLHPVYAAAYHVSKTLCGKSIGPAAQQSLITKIASNSIAKIDRPSFSIEHNRELLLSIKHAELKNELTPDEYLQASTFPIGQLDASVCHIGEDDNNIRGYSPARWHIFEPIFREEHKIAHATMTLLQHEYAGYPHTDTDAHVLYDASLSPEERTAVTKRRAIVCNAVSHITGIPVTDNNVPCIAVCLSGGGMRAATCSHGFIEGLKKTELLDSITYISALSGSTWFLTDWLSYNDSEDRYHKHFLGALAKAHLISPVSLTKQLLRKAIFHQDSSIVDLYGTYLASTFFSKEKEPEAKLFTSISEKIKDGRYPFPLCTAVETSAENNWLVCTPYDIMSETLNFRMPTWAFGREFVNGISKDRAPEYPLGFFMDMWGSALSGSLADIYDAMRASHDNPIIQRTIRSLLADTELAEIRPAAIHVHNPLYGMDESAHRNIKEFTIMDPGYSSNLPTPPVSHPERKADIIIILDVSESVCHDHSELKKSADLAQQQRKLFPPIDYGKIGQDPITIFTDPQNPECPAVVYIFPTKNPSYDPDFDPAKLFSKEYPSARFIYTRDAVNKLEGLIESIIISHQEELRELIRQKTIQKQENSAAPAAN